MKQFVQRSNISENSHQICFNLLPATISVLKFTYFLLYPIPCKMNCLETSPPDALYRCNSLSESPCLPLPSYSPA